ncbi:hypothetical protein E2C01_067233 [Portunus trituberculatus]|uniref:Uncharacterized protein n=1 Tax=Portunus trituberculatus TaxID=210409 RepID=A0A5B7HKG2_PORTR|nr:hypothetical protein [Portunus trituberculatus]
MAAQLQKVMYGSCTSLHPPQPTNLERGSDEPQMSIAKSRVPRPKGQAQEGEERRRKGKRNGKGER